MQLDNGSIGPRNGPRPGWLKLLGRRQLWAIAIVLAVLVAYIPAMRGSFIWDDDDYVSRNANLHNLHGLWRIWFEFGSTPQYYPLVFTSYWLESRLWELHPFGYHLVNVLLHALNSLLLARVLLRLRVPGAWLAAALFALHPVHVESVAWITERKNVLSAFFYLSSLNVYLRYCGFRGPSSDIPTSAQPPPDSPARHGRSNALYYAALVLYLAALLSKTVTSSLPVAILLILWWKQRRLSWRDLLPVAPFFAIGLAMGLITIWMEKTVVGAKGLDWDLSFVERCLIAGRDLWFYLGKLLWPTQLSFNYPRWQIDAASGPQYLFPLMMLALLAVLWLLRKRLGKGPLVALTYFILTLAPALGFIDVFPLKFSFVADHFQYLASIGPLTLLAALVATGLGRLQPSTRLIGAAPCALCLAVLALLVWRQGHAYRDLESLWRDTIAKSPQSSLGHNNLGVLLLARARSAKDAFPSDGSIEFIARDVDVPAGVDPTRNPHETLAQAIFHFQQDLRFNPASVEAHINLGHALALESRTDEAIAHYRQALQLRPDLATIHSSLATLLGARGKHEEAIDHYRQALVIRPTHAHVHSNLGAIYQTQGKLEAALHHYRQALAIEPAFAKARCNLATALAAQGSLEEAVHHFRRSLESDPNYADAHYSLGTALGRLGDLDGAVRSLQQCLEVDPRYIQAHYNLALALRSQGKLNEAINHFRRTLELDPNHQRARQSIASILQKGNQPQPPP